MLIQLLIRDRKHLWSTAHGVQTPKHPESLCIILHSHGWLTAPHISQCDVYTLMWQVQHIMYFTNYFILIRTRVFYTEISFRERHRALRNINVSISSHKKETISILSLADLKCTLKMGLCYFEWENDCHSNCLLNQTGASWLTQQSFTGTITAQSSVGTCLVHFFDVQASVRLCVSAQASTLVQDQGQAAALKSGFNTPFWIIQPSSH